jgi:hypothetical protein
VPVPFRDYLGSVRFDWAQSPEVAVVYALVADSYITHNALVAQATLPSTGLTTHNNYLQYRASAINIRSARTLAGQLRV